MTFTELKYYVAVYEKNSIRTVADAFFVSPSVVSSAIKRLENEYNVELFIRASNRLIPTAEGSTFYRFAVELLNTLQLLESNMQANRRSIYNIALSPLVYSVYPEFLSDFQLGETSLHFEIISDTFFKEYHNYDISIVSFATKSLQSFINTKIYTVMDLWSYPTYIWTSNAAMINRYGFLSPEILSQYTNIILKDHPFEHEILTLFPNSLIIDSQKDFIDMVKNDPNYFAFDTHSNLSNDLYYKYLLMHTNVQQQLFTQWFCWSIIYKKSLPEQLIADLITYMKERSEE